jgi:hypothetical protein
MVGGALEDVVCKRSEFEEFEEFEKFQKFQKFQKFDKAKIVARGAPKPLPALSQVSQV